MESYNSIEDFVCRDSLSHIDSVILNTGISPLRFTAIPTTGHEKAIQVNHISTVLLTILLLPVLKGKARGNEPPRLPLVNSITSHLCKFPNRRKRPTLLSFEDMLITGWNAPERYGVFNLLCQLFVVKLADNVKR